MKILCLNPPFKTEFGRFSRTSRSPAITKSGTIYYPIWLCYVVLMGTHPSALPAETLQKNSAIDAIFIGEADYTARELAQKLSESDLQKIKTDSLYRNNILSRVDGLAYRSNEKIHVNKRREFIKDLDELAFVSQVYKRHLDTRKYFFAASDYPEVQIMTARGCIARCTFCVYPQTIHGWKYRTRSPQNIADEFQWIIEKMPEGREIGSEDDTFTGSQQRTAEVCKELIKRNVKIKWYCNVRADLKYETMQWMRKAGCVIVTVGYERANREGWK